MQLFPLQSQIIEANDNLIEKIATSLENNQQVLKNKDILVVSSKVVALCQGRTKQLNNPDDKNELRELVKEEAEKWYPGDLVDFTLKYNIIIPNAGIDKSNARPGTVILWPTAPQKTVDDIRSALITKYNLTDLGIILIDSRCQPLRQGVSGISIAYSGIIGVEDNRGEPDLFGRPLAITRQSKADELACAANLLMGEGNQAIPFVIVREAPIKFTNIPQDSLMEQFIDPKACIFNAVFNY
ncbi:hypothetical protein COV81_04600 [Candidatus Peregrinibacteria bacterium CG11_big_fil_rev_8_21_14_0_20_41_10]|nr:MAG: hypothetical protein COV81_04600 [Candidatus Peregrinibacteria bacterium CG11_big_fil_rev_8_21_14_0_20_41_10]